MNQGGAEIYAEEVAGLLKALQPLGGTEYVRLSSEGRG
jgi:hypothetical protein